MIRLEGKSSELKLMIAKWFPNCHINAEISILLLLMFILMVREKLLMVKLLLIESSHLFFIATTTATLRIIINKFSAMYIYNNASVQYVGYIIHSRYSQTFYGRLFGG